MDEHSKGPVHRTSKVLDWQQQLGLIISAAIAGMTALNISAAANWRPETALAILRETGTGAVLVGSLVALLPYVLSAALGGLSAHLLYRAICDGRRRPFPTLPLFLTLVLALIGVGALSILLWGFVVLMVLVATMFALLDRGADAHTRSGNMRAFATFLLWPVLLFLIGGAVWLPRENLDFAGSDDDGSAYVLAIGREEIAILTVTTRRVVYLRNLELLERQICGSSTHWTLENLPGLVSKPRSEPPCMEAFD